jgi:hypothetical protein
MSHDDEKKIKAAKSTSRNDKWVSLLKHQWKGHKVTTAIRTKVVYWIMLHEHVVNSPIYNKTLLINKDPVIQSRRV